MRLSKLDRLAGVESLLFESVQFFILKNRPPFPFGHAILRRAFAPGLGDVPFRGHGGGGTLVLRPDGAAGRNGKDNKRIQRYDVLRTSHYCLLDPCAGAACWPGPEAPLIAMSFTRTSWPSSRDRRGLAQSNRSDRAPARLRE